MKRIVWLANAHAQCQLVWQYGQDCFIISFISPQHNDKEEGHLLHMVIIFYEHVHCQQLREGVEAQFKGDIHVPGFRLARTSNWLLEAMIKMAVSMHLKRKDNFFSPSFVANKNAN